MAARSHHQTDSGEPSQRRRCAMKGRIIHAQDLIGRTVHDSADQKVGRIEEIKMEETADGCFVDGYALGPRGLLQRLSFRGIGPLFFRSLVAEGKAQTHDVPWE